MPWVETCGGMLRASRRANYLGVGGVCGVLLQRTYFLKWAVPCVACCVPCAAWSVL